MNQRILSIFVLMGVLLLGGLFAGGAAFAAQTESPSPAYEAAAKGIVNAETLNIRTDAGTNYAIIEQLNKGDQVSVLEKRGDWYKVDFEGLRGWAYGGAIEDMESVMQPEFAKNAAQLSREAYAAKEEIRQEEQNDSQKTAQAVVQQAKSHLGKPYRYGAAGPDSFDCSGLVSYCFASQDITVPRCSKDYGGIGVEVDSSQAQPGDIVCFNTSGSGISHVGIYIGEGAFIHAASGSSTHKVMINTLSESYYQNRLVTIRRIL